MMQARCYPQRSLRTLALMTAHALPSLKWRVHGIGLLQAYLVEEDPEIRVHIWCESLLSKPGIVDSGAIHDHRFELASTVLLGTITHEEYRLTPCRAPGAHDIDGRKTWALWTVPNARTFQAQRVGEMTRSDDRLYHAAIESTQINEGTRYTFPRGVFHRATASDLTVTVVTKYDQQHDLQARILAPAGTTPEHAFKWIIDDATIGGVVQRAREALLTKYRTETLS